MERPTHLKRKLAAKVHSVQYKSKATKETTQRIIQSALHRAAKNIKTIGNSTYFFTGKSLFFMDKGKSVLVLPNRVRVPGPGNKEILMVRDPSNGNRFILEGDAIREPKPNELPPLPK